MIMCALLWSAAWRQALLAAGLAIVCIGQGGNAKDVLPLKGAVNPGDKLVETLTKDLDRKREKYREGSTAVAGTKDALENALKVQQNYVRKADAKERREKKIKDGKRMQGEMTNKIMAEKTPAERAKMLKQRLQQKLNSPEKVMLKKQEEAKGRNVLENQLNKKKLQLEKAQKSYRDAEALRQSRAQYHAEQQFQILDANKDEKVTKEEMQETYTKLRARRVAGEKLTEFEGTLLGKTERGKVSGVDYFSLFDNDVDQFITKDEYTGTQAIKTHKQYKEKIKDVSIEL